MGTAIAFALTAMQHIPAMLAAGRDIVAHVSETMAVLKRVQAEGGDPSPADWTALNMRIDAQLAELDAQVKKDETDGA